MRLLRPSERSETRKSEQSELEHLKNRYLYYLEEGEISEGTTNIMVPPLLNALGLCDLPDRIPYRIRGEQWTRLTLKTDAEEGPITIEGRMDALVMQDNFWLAVVEGKRGGFNVLQAVPQALSYMMATPVRGNAVFGLVTSGYDYLFIKLRQGETSRYALSHNFTLLLDESNNLLRVAQILKQLIVSSQ